MLGAARTVYVDRDEESRGMAEGYGATAVASHHELDRAGAFDVLFDAGAQLSIGERHACGQDPDAHLARPRSRILLLDELQDLGPAVVIDDDTLHRGLFYAGPTFRASDQSRGFDQ
jgi:hypothetical protein